MFDSIPHNCQISELNHTYSKYFNRVGTFVDVGAHDGYNFSNTYPLLLEGWKGVAFEPHPKYFLECAKLYNDYPKALIYNFAIGNFNGMIKLYDAGTLSTTSLETLELYENISWSKDLVNRARYFTVQQFTLSYFLNTMGNPPVDVMSIDTEGTEDLVLEGLGNYDVKMFIIETHENSIERELSTVNKVERYLENYTKIYTDAINSIYVRNNET